MGKEVRKIGEKSWTEEIIDYFSASLVPANYARIKDQ